MNITDERKLKLLHIAITNFNNISWFHSHEIWDKFIEFDMLTENELEWMADNFEVKVFVRKNNI